MGYNIDNHTFALFLYKKNIFVKVVLILHTNSYYLFVSYTIIIINIKLAIIKKDIYSYIYIFMCLLP